MGRIAQHADMGGAPDGGDLNAVVVFPHAGGTPMSGTDEPMNESETEALRGQKMIVYGRNGNQHFEAVMKKTD